MEWIARLWKINSVIKRARHITNVLFCYSFANFNKMQNDDTTTGLLSPIIILSEYGKLDPINP